MADREGEEWPIVFPSRSKAERISDLSPSVQQRTGNLDFKRPSFEPSSPLTIGRFQFRILFNRVAFMVVESSPLLKGYAWWWLSFLN